MRVIVNETAAVDVRGWHFALNPYLWLGVLVACAPGLQRRLPPQVAIVVVGGCAFLHGLAHGQELAGMASGAGFLVASALVMLAGALPGERVRRMAGAAIGASGLYLLAGVV